MNTDGLQVGKIRWCHDKIGNHLVWIPKNARKIFTGGQLRQKRKKSLQNAVSNMIFLFWHFPRTGTMFMTSFVLLPGSHPQLLRDSSRGIPLDTFERSFLIWGKSTYGQARILLERQEVYQQKLSGALSLSAKERSRKANRARFHPNPPFRGMGLPACLSLKLSLFPPR